MRVGRVEERRHRRYYWTIEVQGSPVVHKVAGLVDLKNTTLTMLVVQLCMSRMLW